MASVRDRIDIDRLPSPLVSALEPLRRERAARRYSTGRVRRAYPRSAEELRESDLLSAWWYYSIELLPGVMTRGQHPHERPMLPRQLLRRADVSGQRCLDVGPMEGLVPVLLAKRGANVSAVDFSNHCLGKLEAVKSYHGVDFEYESVGLMYDLGRRLASRGFDLINLSGLLYHVFSPLMLLGAVRPLLNRDGVMVVSTYVTLDPAPVMDFNAGGRMWAEGNTFWFPSVALLDYLLRYLRLLPIDCAFTPDSELRDAHHAKLGRNAHIDFGKDSGYLSVACRAVDPLDSDPWMAESARSSWEYHGLVDWERADARPRSSIGYDSEPAGGIELDRAVRERPATTGPAELGDSHVLTLSATS